MYSIVFFLRNKFAEDMEGGLPDAVVGGAPYAESLTSMVSPLVVKVDDGVQQALNSQAVLAQQIDRVAGELQSFLTGSQIPSFAPHAQRLQEIRKRVGVANGTLTQVQTRLARIEGQAAQMKRDLQDATLDVDS